MSTPTHDLIRRMRATAQTYRLFEKDPEAVSMASIVDGWADELQQIAEGRLEQRIDVSNDDRQVLS